jgi:hypothetical protein
MGPESVAEVIPRGLSAPLVPSETREGIGIT